MWQHLWAEQLPFSFLSNVATVAPRSQPSPLCRQDNVAEQELTFKPLLLSSSELFCDGLAIRNLICNIFIASHSVEVAQAGDGALATWFCFTLHHRAFFFVLLFVLSIASKTRACFDLQVLRKPTGSSLRWMVLSGNCFFS